MANVPDPPELDPDDPFGFNDNPLAVKEFLDARNAINTPWFRMRFLFALWRERIGDWFRKRVRGKTGMEIADRRDRSFEPCAASPGRV